MISLPAASLGFHSPRMGSPTNLQRTSPAGTEPKKPPLRLWRTSPPYAAPAAHPRSHPSDAFSSAFLLVLKPTNANPSDSECILEEGGTSASPVSNQASVTDGRRMCRPIALETPSGSLLPGPAYSVHPCSAAFTLDKYGHVVDEMRKASSERMQKLIYSMSM